MNELRKARAIIHVLADQNQRMQKYTKEKESVNITFKYNQFDKKIKINVTNADLNLKLYITDNIDIICITGNENDVHPAINVLYNLIPDLPKNLCGLIISCSNKISIEISEMQCAIFYISNNTNQKISLSETKAIELISLMARSFNIII